VVAEVYAQVDAEFSSIGPAVRMTSPAPEVLAAGWVLMRESQLVGSAPALDKALVALGVSQANDCTYDVVAWLAILRALGRPDLAEVIEQGGTPDDARLAALLAWARSTGTAGEPKPLPGGAVAEYVGTALFNHFINRLVLAMLPADLLPGSLDPADEPPFEDAPVLRQLRTDRTLGASLSLLAEHPMGTVPAWAEGAPAGRAYAALAATAGQGGGLLSAAAREVVSEVVTTHHGRRPDSATPSDRSLGESLDELLHGPLSALPEPERLGARLAILAGLAPGAITDEAVAAWRATDRRFSDHCTVYVLAYGAMAAVGHIEADLAQAHARSSR